MRERAAALGIDRHVASIAAVVVVGAIMSILDTTIVNIALTKLGQDLHASLADVQWVATGYLLALAIVIPLTGWSAERFGARRVWLTSVVLFVIGSVLCGLAWSLPVLIAFRVLQGLGGGMIMPVGMIMLAQAAGPARIGRVMSVIGLPMILAPVLGPALGGLIVDNASWRWIFFVNVPIGALGLALGLRLLPALEASKNPGRLDVTGLALLSPGLAGIVFGLSEVSTQGGISSTQAWLPLVAGAVLVVLFVRHALRAERPLIDVALFRTPAVGAAAATTFLTAAALFGSLLLLPLFFQVARGESALDAGLLQAPQGLGVALAMPFAGLLTDRVGGGRVVVVGLLVLAAATVPLALVDAHTSLLTICLILFARGLGVGGAMMPAMAAAYAALDTAAIPRATSALNVIQRVGGSIGTAVLAVVLQHEISSKLPGTSGGLTGVRDVAPAARARLAEPLNTAFGSTFWWAVGLTVVALVPALALMRATQRGGRVAPRAVAVPAAGD
jgi:EmrB/QacA subfamily drug resistance transporter